MSRLGSYRRLIDLVIFQRDSLLRRAANVSVPPIRPDVPSEELAIRRKGFEMTPADVQRLLEPERFRLPFAFQDFAHGCDLQRVELRQRVTMSALKRTTEFLRRILALHFHIFAVQERNR